MPLPDWSRLGHDVREYFLLEDTEARLAALPEAARTQGAVLLARAFQKRNAAELLWPRGCPAESVRLIQDAFTLASQGVERIAGGGRTADVTAPFPPLAKASRILEGARVWQAAAPTPEVDAEVTSAHGDVLRGLLDALYEVERALYPAFEGAAGISRARRRRFGWGLFTLVIIALGTSYAYVRARALHAEASATAVPDGAALAVDGSDATEWLLPNQTAGSLDVTFSRRKVRNVTITQARGSRGIRAYDLACFDGLNVVAMGSEVGAETEPSPRLVLHVNQTCTHARLTVKSWWRDGAGVAELTVD